MILLLLFAFGSDGQQEQHRQAVRAAEDLQVTRKTLEDLEDRLSAAYPDAAGRAKASQVLAQAGAILIVVEAIGVAGPLVDPMCVVAAELQLAQCLPGGVIGND